MLKDKENYYTLLGLHENASLSEIKKAFRERAKKLHPDTGATGSRSELAMRKLLTAYQVLSNKALRKKYNEELRRHRAAVFDYREYLKGRNGDLSSLAKLIFFDLLHERDEEALKLYRELEEEKGGSLEDLLGPEDYMDCAFLLSEAYENQNDYESAFRLLYRISELEMEIHYFRHFTEIL
jgi:curved DNA-binding protein CbpA